MAIKQFLYTNNEGYYTEGNANSNHIKRACDSGLAVGDLVMESTTIVNGVDKVIDNMDTRSVIGYCVEKIDSTNALIITKGNIDSLSGLTKGNKVYLSDIGGFSDSKPTSGYLQVLGHAIESTKIDFNPANTKIKVYKEPMTFPLTETKILQDNAQHEGVSFGSCINSNKSTLYVGASSPNVYYRSVTEFSLPTFDRKNIIIKNNHGSNSEYDWFGATIAVNASNDVMIIGLSNYDGQSGNGEVEFYRRSGTTWSLEQTITKGNGKNYGLSIAISDDGNFAVIAEPHNYRIYTYMYDGNSWVAKQTLTGSSSVGNLGDIMSITGDRTWLATKYGTKLRLYKYDTNNDTYSLDSELNLPIAYLDIYDNNLIIGMAGDDTYATDAGKTVIYNYDGSSWSQKWELPIYGLTPQAHDYFGGITAIYKNIAVVYATLSDRSEKGGIFFYKYDENSDTWNGVQKVLTTTSNEYQRNNEFVNIGINDDYIFVGSSIGGNGQVSIFN